LVLTRQRSLCGVSQWYFGPALFLSAVFSKRVCKSVVMAAESAQLVLIGNRLATQEPGGSDVGLN
jgi:hypothetical protein